MDQKLFLEHMTKHMLDLQESGDVLIGILHDDDSPILVFDGWMGVYKMFTYLAIEAGIYEQYIPILDLLELSEHPYDRPKIATLTLIPGPSPVLFPDIYIDNERQYRLIEKLQPFPEPMDEWLSLFYERFGEFSFSNEYSTCAECGKVIRTSPDSYSWTPDYIETEDGYVHVDCADTESTLDEYKNRNRALPYQIQSRAIEDGLLVELSDIEYENGFHPGMNDDPKIIIRTMRKVGIDVWFNVEPSQFYVDFTVLVHPDNEEKARKILESLDVYQGYDTSEEMSKALRGEHSDYITRVEYKISPQDFIDGNLPH